MLKDTPLIPQEHEELVRSRKEERKKQNETRIEEMEKCPRVGILPSPDELDIPGSPGVDDIETRKDFHDVWKWAMGNEFLNTGFYDEQVKNVEEGKQIEIDEFGPLVDTAYKLAFDHIRDTKSPEKEEMVVLYYAGHGLDEDEIPNIPEEVPKSPFPNIPTVADDYFKDADDFSEPTPQVKGGEFYLHHRGFCDLRGLLRPFMAAINHEDPEKRKKNKHLLIIADSCFSGILADDLEKLENDGTLKSYIERGCSVTVQASCGSDEEALSGYFTPSFLHLNRENNYEKLFDEWVECKDSNDFLDNFEDLQSPRVASTLDELKNGDMNLTRQNSTIHLINDAKFLKFCYKKVLDNQPSLVPRKLKRADVTTFLTQPSFKVIDFKLKTYKSPPYKNTPMGLFLIEEGKNGSAICADVHYEVNFKDIHSINFYQCREDSVGKYKKRSFTSYLMKEDELTDNAKRMERECKKYVRDSNKSLLDDDFESWWENSKNWNMKDSCEKKFRKRTLFFG